MGYSATFFIEAALKRIGVIAQGESVSANDATDSLKRLNEWIDGLGTHRLTMHYVARTTKVLAAGTASYTIGSGGSINLVRPVFIDHVGLIIDNTADPVTEIPITLFSDQQWQAIAQKDFDSTLSQGIYYDHNFNASSFGLVYPWPIPTVGTTSLVLYTPGAGVSEFADLTTEYVFPQGWRRALGKNLIVELADEFGKPISGTMQADAADALADVKRVNLRMPEMGLDPMFSGTGAYYDIETDQ